jgi:glucokinase
MSANQLIGVDIGGTQIKLAAFSADGKMTGHWIRETGDRPVQGIPPFAEIVRRMLSEFASPDAHIGIAAPGLAASDGRSIAFQPGKMHGIENFDWTEFLQSRKVVPVLNDAHAALLGEVWQGAASGSDNAILLTLGTGVGGAILSEGKLLKGSIGRAGHLGHISVCENDELSIFGTPGSLEAAVGNHSITKRGAGRFTSTLELVKAHQAGDVTAAELWLRTVRTLARAIASFINMLDPQIVIIGGGIAKSGKALFEPLGEFLDEMEWRPDGHHVRIVPAALGEWAGAYGAARNAMHLNK